MGKFDASANYKIIMTGDFNEAGWNWGDKKLNPMSWQPLKHAGVLKDVKISNIIFSCNKATGCWHREDGDGGGDYIFYSEKAAQITVPGNYIFAPEGACSDVATMQKIWQSDHLPVMSELS